MNKRISIFTALLLLMIAPAAVRAQAPGVVTYQGRITNNGANFTGTGEFRFVIYRNGLPPATLWSHDSSSIGGAMPATVVALPVTNGLFSVGLGDTSIPGMVVAIPASIFANSSLRLRVWFSDGVVDDAVIADHAITSTGYAFFAQSVADGSITSGKLATGAVNSAALANDVTFSNVRLDSAGTETVTLLAASGAGEGAQFDLRNGANQVTMSLDADASGDASSLSLFNSAGSLAVLIDGDEGSGIGGRITVYNNAGAQRAELDGQGSSGGGELVLDDADGTVTVNLRAADSATTGARLELFEADGTRTVNIDAEGSTGGGVIELFKANGTRTIYIDADNAGDGRISTQVLEITGGSDFSENFDIRSADAQPGMLVRIDPAHPGDLAVSERAYDRTVAGVVSGAGGVKPGVRMGQRGTRADGRHPVALTGRVYCLVDADRGAIEPGDLITTSDTLGHGMKVGDHARAQGAIIGKAMTPLASGRGLVLLLVNLQ